MSPEGVLTALIVLVIILVFVMPMVLSKNKEGFYSNSGIAAFDKYLANPSGYNDEGAKKYNPFSAMQDVTLRNFAMAETDASIDKASAQLRTALRTSEITVDPTSKTFEGVNPSTPALGVAPNNQIILEAKKCEALNSRDNCASLDDPKFANCGVCVKDRTTMFKNPNDKFKQGGLLVIPEDRRDAVTAHGSRRGPVQYTATVGNCPPNYLFVDSKSCKREADRLDCLEAGQNGGFNNGRTSEGKDVIGTKCAAAPTVGSDVFIYDPKNRSFDVNLRVLTPSGTGKTNVVVVTFNNNGTFKKEYGASTEKPGVEFVVNVKNVIEGEEVLVLVFQEVPHRNKGKAEVFRVDTGGYNQTIETSKNVCARIGTRIATEGELQQAFVDGAQVCGCANTSSSCKFPGQANRPGCGGIGLTDCTTNPNNWNGGKGASWCFGVKPPNSTDRPSGMMNMRFNNWFETYGKESSPSQEDKPSQWSKWGNDYQAPSKRAVIMQWENVDDSKRMSQPFEPSITRVQFQPPNTVTSDGLKTFKLLRRFGTYKNSSIITSPRPVQGSAMVTSQFWIWANQETDHLAYFHAKIPGTFAKPAYDEDNAIARRGQLIANPETFKLLQISPCLKEGQVAGKYSQACLANLFVGSGGDIMRGKLATIGMVNPYDGSVGNGLNDLNKLGDMDAISAYLDNQFTIATTGVDSNGNKVGKDDKKAYAIAINTAAQLMFGFDISTPCEDIVEDFMGNIVIVPKKGTLDSFCLQWLWQNTGTDRDRFNEDPSRFEAPRKGGVRNTYTSIGDRYSGLRYSEATFKQREKSPFQTCQPKGTASPVDANGKPNEHNIGLANRKGGINQIQEWYDSLHKWANYGGYSKDPEVMKLHADAVAACYGITKSPDPPQPDCSALPTSYVPRQNTRLGEVNITGDYILSFTITLNSVAPHWQNIIRFQRAPGDQGDCCGFGQRAPAIWVYPNNQSNLHVRIGDASDGNWGIDTAPIPVGRPTKFRLECIGRSVKIFIDEQLRHNQTQPSRRWTGKAVVYGTDPYYHTVNAEIKDFKFDSRPVSASVLGTIGIGPWHNWAQFQDRQAQWIWDDPNGARGVEAGKLIFFSKVFSVNSSTEATVHVIADDGGEVFINDVKRGGIAGGGWGTTNYTKIKVGLTAGTQTIRISAINGGGPAGLVASVIASNGQILARTDGSWTVTY